MPTVGDRVVALQTETTDTWYALDTEGTSGGGASPLTTKGDVWGYDTADNRIPIGNDGEVLIADAGEALGLKWGIPDDAINARAVILNVTQVAHGFSFMDVIRVDGTSGGLTTYTKAKADTIIDAEVVGLVTGAIDADHFQMTEFGLIQGLGIPGVGQYFLSDTTAGAYTLTEPTTIGHISKPIFFGKGASDAFVAIQRSKVIGSGGATSPLTTKGDVWGFDTADARVPVGTNGQVLTADSTDAQGVSWQTPSSGLTSPLTTKGDVWGYSTVNARVPVGSNGQVLTADSTQTLGVHWTTPGGSGLPAGDPASLTLDTTSYANNVSGSGNLTTAMFPGDTAIFAAAITGDAYPRWLWASDATDGFYFGDGTIDPYSGAAISVASGSNPVFRLSGGYDDVWVGPNDTNVGGYSQARHAWKIGTTGGIIMQSASGVPTFSYGGNVGDWYFRSDGGTTDPFYVCTSAGVAGAATWVSLIGTIPPPFALPFTDTDASTTLTIAHDKFQSDSVSYSGSAYLNLNTATPSAFAFLFATYDNASANVGINLASIGTSAVDNFINFDLMAAAGVYVFHDKYMDFSLSSTIAGEPASPAGPPLARLFVRVNGGGKYEFCAKFPSGATQVMATQP